MAGHIPEAFYIVADFGRLGRSSVIDWEHCTKQDMIAQLKSGEYDKPLEVHCIDRDGGTWSDVSEDVAREILGELREEPTDGLLDFLENNLGCGHVADKCRELEAA